MSTEYLILRLKVTAYYKNLYLEIYQFYRPKLVKKCSFMERHDKLVVILRNLHENYLLYRNKILNIRSPMAISMPAIQSAVIHPINGSDIMRSSFTTKVRSGGTFPPGKNKLYKITVN